MKSMSILNLNRLVRIGKIALFLAAFFVFPKLPLAEETVGNPPAMGEANGNVGQAANQAEVTSTVGPNGVEIVNRRQGEPGSDIRSTERVVRDPNTGTILRRTTTINTQGDTKHSTTREVSSGPQGRSLTERKAVWNDKSDVEIARKQNPDGSVTVKKTVWKEKDGKWQRVEYSEKIHDSRIGNLFRRTQATLKAGGAGICENALMKARIPNCASLIDKSVLELCRSYFEDRKTEIPGDAEREKARQLKQVKKDIDRLPISKDEKKTLKKWAEEDPDKLKRYLAYRDDKGDAALGPNQWASKAKGADAANLVKSWDGNKRKAWAAYNENLPAGRRVSAEEWGKMYDGWDKNKRHAFQTYTRATKPAEQMPMAEWDKRYGDAQQRYLSKDRSHFGQLQNRQKDGSYSCEGWSAEKCAGWTSELNGRFANPGTSPILSTAGNPVTRMREFWPVQRTQAVVDARSIYDREYFSKSLQSAMRQEQYAPLRQNWDAYQKNGGTMPMYDWFYLYMYPQAQYQGRNTPLFQMASQFHRGQYPADTRSLEIPNR